MLMQALYGQKLVFFGIIEPLTSLMKLSFLLSFIILLAPILFSLTMLFARTFELKTPFFIDLSALSLFLYFIGIIFCLSVTLPFGIKFLLAFQNEALQPAISVTRFIDFTLFLGLIFGIIFQLPILILFLSYTGIINVKFLKKNRKIAFLLIMIVSAMLTPTPDILNLLLMAVPFYFLYETGIIVSDFYVQKS